MDSNAISIKSLETYFGVNGKKFSRQYKEKLSDFKKWSKKSHAQDYLIYPENIDSHLALDETCLSNAELYTILSNKLKKGQKGSIVALFKGTKPSDIIKLIKEHISEKVREKVLEVSVDMANNMNLIIKKCFKKARAVTDRSCSEISFYCSSRA